MFLDKTMYSETVGLTVAVPLNKVSVKNLANILEAQAGIIKKALGISELPIVVDEKNVSFPWFEDGVEVDNINAYSNFIAALCKMSRDSKHKFNIEKTMDNEKYAFRCLLIILGFEGEKYKADREILMKAWE